MLKWKKLFVSLLSVSVIAGIGAAPVMAAQTTTPYTYKVTLSAGNKGTIKGQQKVEETDLAAGSTVTFNLNDILVTDEKYYVKGIRLSGRDNSEALAAPAFVVDSDADYVVAYGIKGNMVAYTVNYEDEQGNTLAESQTFYGNVGDKPVVAYRYIENYVPQALTLTKTLSDNAANNVFTFKYAPGSTNRVIETVNNVTVVVPGNTITNTVTVPAGTTGTTGGNGTGANGTGTNGANGANGANGTNADGTTTPDGTDANGGQDTNQGDTVENPDQQTPQDQIDLDDEDTPTGNIDADKKDQKVNPMNVSIAIIVAVVVALIALLVTMKRRKKEDK
ncbi:MucBP domain-containing protein [uncultured Eubacterium sp.]|uniref:MucBP domain-containing protein n=1 Tax=uncultured Eubacterium sp. TaxID=165185 RepID=UPI0025F8FBAC|nr:MucBP domain-containing protein [uncultured Eubacterium sp.]MCI6536248.1 hypothetical protein [Lachnospiraceae bacterium]